MPDTKPRSTPAQIIATVRDNLKEEYAKRIPDPTKEGIAEVGKAFTTDTIVMNEFMKEFINKVIIAASRNKANYQSPFRQFYEADVPLGANIEEHYVNPAVDTGYQADPGLLLKETNPDAKVCYYGMNRRGRYTVTKFEHEIARAFTSDAAFNQFKNEIVNTIYSGDSIDEFILGKNMIGAAIDNNVMNRVQTNIADPKSIAKAISILAKSMTFPGTFYCGYNKANNLTNASDEKPCITWTPKQDLIVILRHDVETEIDFEYLAMLYNMSLAEITERKVILDDIPTKDNMDVHAIICDKTCLQFRDFVNEAKEFENGSNMKHTYWYHHWEALYWQMFGNAIVLGDMPESATVTETAEMARKAAAKTVR